MSDFIVDSEFKEKLAETDGFSLSFANTKDVEGESAFEQEKRGFSFLSFTATLADENHTVALNTEKEKRRMEFETNYSIWNNQTCFLANNNYDNDYFKEIVNMGEEVVPLILKELQKGPTPLVHALNLIYPNMVKYEGYLPLDAICLIWETILTQKEIR